MLKKKANIFHTLQLLVLMALLSACNTTRHVGEGKYLLNEVKLQINDTSKTVNAQKLSAYIRQKPNQKMLWALKFRLGIYNLSGSDSAKWWNKWMRKLGEPPVIYDAAQATADSAQLQRALENAGYRNAHIKIDTQADSLHRKLNLRYTLTPGQPHRIRSIEYVYPDQEISATVSTDSSIFLIQPGDALDLTQLENQRDAIVSHLRDNGYYAFGKEYITFNADTAENSLDVDLKMTLLPFENNNSDPENKSDGAHRKYIIGNVFIIPDYDPLLIKDIRDYQANDTVRYKTVSILYGAHRQLRPGILYENCFLTPGETYSLSAVNKTYNAFSRLGFLKFISVRLLPGGDISGTPLLNAYILLTPGKSQSFSAELEGTNSEGNFGIAAALNYTHRNIGKGSETLTTKIRGAYEALNSSFHDILHNRYLEFGGEASINFPKFKAPLLKESFKRKIKASTEFNISMNYQERPEYTRLISTAGWSYKWAEPHNLRRHIFTPVDINYVYLPESTYDFLDRIAPDNPLLRYSYEDHFIMRMGYTFYQTNKRSDSPYGRNTLRDIYTLRVNAEIAGNLLFAISSAVSHRSDFHSNPYKVFGIRYSQYAKADADYSYLKIIDQRNSIAFHAGGGVGVPYGNSTILPFEKRFYGGGANGVRGWAVRTLGPGRFPGTNSVSDFINQCGDIRLDFSAEYRPKLFWILEGALFIDAGNIWTIHNYRNQPEGFFRFKSFYKEIALAYGAGLRLDFNYFLIRFDMGMKAHNPAINQEKWPIIHPNWKRDHSFHFSIGYPF